MIGRDGSIKESIANGSMAANALLVEELAQEICILNMKFCTEFISHCRQSSMDDMADAVETLEVYKGWGYMSSKARTKLRTEARDLLADIETYPVQRLNAV